MSIYTLVHSEWSLYLRRTIGFLSKGRMGGACRTYGGEGSCIHGFGNRRERDHLKDPGVDARIILRWVFRKWDVGMD